MNTKDIIKRVRRIELKSRRKVSQLFMGEYHSSFKGRGMTFSEVRPYEFGDDVRNIDWNKTAHFNEPYVKVFEEERELTLLLMIDLSASNRFGTRKQMKLETMAEIAASLAFSAITYNDRVGLILFTEQVEKYIPPGKGRKHVLRIIREIVEFESPTKTTNLEPAFHFLMNSFKRKTNVFIFSDFEEVKAYEKRIKVAAAKHEITGIRIYDEKESAFPKIGLVRVQDIETGQTRLVNTSDEYFLRMHQQYYNKVEKNFYEVFRHRNAGAVNLRSDQDYIVPLINYFQSKGGR